MEQAIYERPREKLLYRGAAFLTPTELLQVVIGSGSKGVSGAQLARKVAKSLQEGRVNYATLAATNGLGHAKTCQILAALELGHRFVQGGRRIAGAQLSADMIGAYLEEVRARGGRYVTCYWFDGSAKVLDYKKYHPQDDAYSEVFARRIMADVVAASAHSVLLFLPSKNADLVPTTGEMKFIQYICEAAGYLHISIIEVCALHKKEHAYWKQEVAL